MPQSLPYVLVPSPETQKAQTPGKSSSGTRAVVNPIAFGHGVVRPFIRDGQGDWAHSADIALVRAEVGQVLGTLGSSGTTQGELPWRPEFGSVLQLLRFGNLDDTLAELARTYVIDAIRVWLFRVRVKDASASIDHSAGALIITIRYDILASNKRSVLSANNVSTVSVPVAA